MIEHALALVLFVLTWPLGALLCIALIRLYLKAMG